MSERWQPQRIRVSLSSPGDVAVERRFVREVAGELSAERSVRGRAVVTVVSWDDPAAGIPMPVQLTPQEAVNRFGPHPSAGDIVVVLLWSRMGTPLAPEYRTPDGEPYLSGTEWDAAPGRGNPDAVPAAPRMERALAPRSPRAPSHSPVAQDAPSSGMCALGSAR